MCVTCCLQLGWTTTVTGHAAQLARTFQHSCTAATVTVVAAGAVARRSRRKCAVILYKKNEDQLLGTEGERFRCDLPPPPPRNELSEFGKA